MFFPDLGRIFSFEHVTAPKKSITYSYSELAKLFFEEAKKEWDKSRPNRPYLIEFEVLHLGIPMNSVEIERMIAAELIESFKSFLLPTKDDALEYGVLDNEGLPIRIRYFLGRIGKFPGDPCKYGAGVLERLNGSTQALLLPPGFNPNDRLSLGNGFKPRVLNHRLVEIKTEAVTEGFPLEPDPSRKFIPVIREGYSYWEPAQKVK